MLLKKCGFIPITGSLICLVLALLSAPQWALADHEAPAIPDTRKYSLLLDETHAKLSRGFNTTISNIDNFFSTQRIEDESTGSRAVLRLTGTMQEGQIFNFNPDFKLRIRLPKLSKRLHLVIQGDVGSNPLEDDGDLSPEEISEQDLQQTTVDATHSIALRYYHRQTQRWNISTTSGLKFRPIPDPFLRLRARRLMLLADWDLRLSAGPFWFETKGLGFDATMEWERPLGLKYNFRSTSGMKWMNETDMYDLGQNFYLTHKFGDQQAVQWRAGAFGQSKPALILTGYLVSVTYRQQLHYEWLYVEAGPVLSFPKTRGFEPTPSFFVGVEATFGRF